MEHGKSQAKLHLWWVWYLEFNYINFMYMYSISSYSQNWFRNSRESVPGTHNSLKGRHLGKELL